MDDQSVLPLIDLIYEAALDPLRWNEFLARFAAAAKSTHVGLLIFDYKDMAHNVPAQFGFTPEGIKQLNEYWGAHDVYIQHAKPFLKTGWIHKSQQYISDRVLVGSRFYNEWAFPMERTFHQCGAVIAHENTRNAVLTTLRPKNMGEFEDEQLRLLRLLLPHLQRATRIHLAMTDLRRHSGQLEFALDKLPTGVVFVASNGYTLFANIAARALLDDGTGVYLDHGILHARDPKASRDLRRMIHEAALTVIGQGIQAGGVLSLLKSTGSPLFVTVAPFRPIPGISPQNTSAIVFINDPERTPIPRENVLRSLFALTPAEAALAELLASGETVASAAEKRGLTFESARSSLKTIFKKTQTNRQTALVRLLMNIRPW